MKLMRTNETPRNELNPYEPPSSPVAEPIEKPSPSGWTAFKFSCYKALAWQAVLMILAAGITPLYAFDIIGNSFLAASGLFWLFVAYVAFRRGRLATRCDHLVISHGLPCLWFGTLSLWTLVFDTLRRVGY